MTDLHDQILAIACDQAQANEEYSDRRSAFMAGHEHAKQQAATLADEFEDDRPDAAVAAIAFALQDSDGMQFLEYWNEGEFDVIRRNWPDAPEEVFIGADILYQPKG